MPTEGRLRDYLVYLVARSRREIETPAKLKIVKGARGQKNDTRAPAEKRSGRVATQKTSFSKVLEVAREAPTAGSPDAEAAEVASLLVATRQSAQACAQVRYDTFPTLLTSRSEVFVAPLIFIFLPLVHTNVIYILENKLQLFFLCANSFYMYINKVVV